MLLQYPAYLFSDALDKEMKPILKTMNLLLPQTQNFDIERL